MKNIFGWLTGFIQRGKCYNGTTYSLGMYGHDASIYQIKPLQLFAKGIPRSKKKPLPVAYETK